MAEYETLSAEINWEQISIADKPHATWKEKIQTVYKTSLSWLTRHQYRVLTYVAVAKNRNH
jgi:hypothetical protein